MSSGGARSDLTPKASGASAVGGEAPQGWSSQTEYGFPYKRAIGLQTQEKYPWSLLQWGGFKDARPVQFLNEDINRNIREALQTYSGEEVARRIDDASATKEIERQQLRAAHEALSAEHGELAAGADSLLRYQKAYASKTSVPEITRAVNVAADSIDEMSKDVAHERANLSRYYGYFKAVPPGVDMSGYARTLNAREQTLIDAEKELAAMQQQQQAIAGLRGRFPKAVSGAAASAFPYSARIGSRPGFERDAPLPPAPAATPPRAAAPRAVPKSAPPRRTAPRGTPAKKKGTIWTS